MVKKCEINKYEGFNKLEEGGEFPKKIKNNKKSPPFMRHLRVRSSKLCTLMIF